MPSALSAPQARLRPGLAAPVGNPVQTLLRRAGNVRRRPGHEAAAFRKLRRPGPGVRAPAAPRRAANPWNCREKAVVTLCVDECGNLVVYVKRL